jgi:hypothetical protein
MHAFVCIYEFALRTYSLQLPLSEKQNPSGKPAQIAILYGKSP